MTGWVGDECDSVCEGRRTLLGEASATANQQSFAAAWVPFPAPRMPRSSTARWMLTGWLLLLVNLDDLFSLKHPGHRDLVQDTEGLMVWMRRAC